MYIIFLYNCIMKMKKKLNLWWFNNFVFNFKIILILIVLFIKDMILIVYIYIKYSVFILLSLDILNVIC